MMDEKDLKIFLKKFADNCHTEQEHQLFIKWLQATDMAQVQKALDLYQDIVILKDHAEANQYAYLAQNIENKLDQLTNADPQKGQSLSRKLNFKRILAVAAVLVLVSMTVLYFNGKNDQDKRTVVKNKTVSPIIELGPGGNKAILTLSDGTSINLKEAKNGLLASQNGLSIRKTATGQLICEASQLPVKNSKPIYNTITTPRGGQYHVVLPDGSKVWLNAASSLKFPVSFSNQERLVELTGEAYFEIAKVTSPSVGRQKGTRIPFKVHSGSQILEVFGTHFNINAYPDEKTINTTLIEGSVKISNDTHYSTFLKPGQLAKAGASLEVLNVDVTEAIAWKNGYFIFSHESIQSIMRKVSRWYDVDIAYQGKVTTEGFVGSVSRFKNVSQVLEMLELTGSVHFKIENRAGTSSKEERRIIVMP